MISSKPLFWWLVRVRVGVNAWLDLLPVAEPTEYFYKGLGLLPNRANQNASLKVNRNRLRASEGSS